MTARKETTEVKVDNHFYFSSFDISSNKNELNKELIPSNLDMKNTGNDEIYINYPPFVN